MESSGEIPGAGAREVAPVTADMNPVVWFCYRLTASPLFEKFVLSVILLNTCWIGIEVDNNKTDEPGNTDPTWMWTVAENIFCVIFTFELIVRLFSHPRMLVNFCTNKKMWQWNLFDTTLVSLMVAETWVFNYVTDENPLKGLSAVRCLRVLRISRAFRMVPELSMMVKSMTAAARSVSSTFILEIGLMYVFAILLTSWAHGEGVRDKCPQPDPSTGVGGICFYTYFGSIQASLMTLMQILVFDDAFQIIRNCMTEAWYIGCLLILFIFIGCFTVLNMLVGVIVEVVSITTKNEKELLMAERIRDVFLKIDTDNSGTISRKEFDAQASKSLRKLGLDKGLIDNVFDIIDTDSSDCLELDEFIRVIFKLIRPPESQDVLKLHQKFDRLALALGIGAQAKSPTTPQIEPPAEAEKKKDAATEKPKEAPTAPAPPLAAKNIPQAAAQFNNFGPPTSHRGASPPQGPPFNNNVSGPTLFGPGAGPGRQPPVNGFQGGMPQNMGPHPYLQGGMPQANNPWQGGAPNAAQMRPQSAAPHAPFQSMQKGHGIHDAENISNIPSSAGGQRQLVGPSHPWQAG